MREVERVLPLPRISHGPWQKVRFDDFSQAQRPFRLSIEAIYSFTYILMSQRDRDACRRVVVNESSSTDQGHS